jgi:prolyl 4-hydroxylase
MPKELEFISTKLSQVFDISSLRLEPPQLTRYEPDQFYKDHWDYFFDENLQGNNRVITAIVYLNDDFTGGNTTFPLLNISIAPKVGRLLYFMYDYDSDINQLTKHSGDTVTSGVKQIVTIWIRKTKWPL